MARLIVCTTGTSIMAREAYAPSETFTRRIRSRFAGLKAEGARFCKEASAEINVLEKLRCGRDDCLLLLSADTADGKAYAEMVLQTAVEEFGTSGEVIMVLGLQIEDASRFRREGIRNLFRVQRDAQEKAQDRNLEFVISLNGGFKSVLPFAALFGMMQRTPAFYAYERRNRDITRLRPCAALVKSCVDDRQKSKKPFLCRSAHRTRSGRSPMSHQWRDCGE